MTTNSDREALDDLLFQYDLTAYTDTISDSPWRVDHDAEIRKAALHEARSHSMSDASVEDTYGNEIERIGCSCGEWIVDGNADPDWIEESFNEHIIKALIEQSGATS